MKAKTTTRVLAALILLCLAILIVRGLRDREPEPSPQAAAPEPATGPAAAASAAQGPDATPSAVPMQSFPEEIVQAFTQEDLQVFIDALLEPELPAEVRVWAIGQFARATIEGEAIDAALRAVLEDPEPEVAAAAAAALSKRGEPGVAAPPTEARKRAPADAGEPAPPGMRIETLD